LRTKDVFSYKGEANRLRNLWNMFTFASCQTSSQPFSGNYKVRQHTGGRHLFHQKLCSKNHIQTNFAQKGRKLPEDDERHQVRKELARMRATTMEGLFGTQKEHYLLRKVQVMKRKAEILYIFFGIHAANLAMLGDKLLKKQLTEAA
jgi:hypothetical protein